MPRRFAALAALAGLCAFPAAGAPPQPGAGALRGEFQASAVARDQAKAEAGRLRQEIADLEAQLAELRTLQASGARTVGGKQARLNALNAREAALQAEMGQNQTQLAQLLGALALYRREAPPALLVNPGSAKDAVRAAILVRAVEPELARRAAAFRAEAETLRRLRRAVDAASEDLFTSESALADGRARIEQTLAQKRALEQRLDADAAQASAMVQSLALRLRALGVDPDSLKAGPGAAPAAAPHFLLHPVDGDLVRRFGQRVAGGPGSDGLAWRTARGAAVRAPTAAVVEYSGVLKGWGGVLILGIGGGYHLVLAGLDRIDAVPGQSLAAGQTVGAMPAESLASPELYLEARENGAPRDPTHWLNAPPIAEKAARR